jgi:hypothetical protein
MGRRSLLVGLFLLGLAAGGCSGSGSKEGPTGTVSGTVTYAGTPLTAGVVNFIGEKRTASGPIQPDGRYTVTAPVGAAKITVTTTQPAAGAAPDIMGGAKAVPIPSRYANPASSNLEYTVTKGKQTHDIDLQR